MLTLGHANYSKMSVVLPQHEEAIRNKLHRYLSDKLDGIYIALKGPSRSHRS